MWYTRPDLRLYSSVLFAILASSCAAPRSVVQAPPAVAPASPAPAARTAPDARAIPRTRDGKPLLDGIWQVRNRAAYGLQDHAARYLMIRTTGSTFATCSTKVSRSKRSAR